MRAIAAARWATCALAITLSATAFADKADKPDNAASKDKSVASCTAFDQVDKGEDAVSFKITNTCTIPLDCSVSWRVVCAPASKKRRSVHASSAKLSLTSASAGATDASASVCGDDSWQIDSVEWTCAPNKD